MTDSAIMDIREKGNPDIGVVLEYDQNNEDKRYEPSSEVAEVLRGYLWYTAKRDKAKYKPDELVDVAMEEALEEVDQEVDEEDIRPYFETELSRMRGSLIRWNPNNSLVAIEDSSENYHSYFS